jgi:hypothetical protein
MIRAFRQFAALAMAFAVLPIAAADEAADKRIANCIVRGGMRGRAGCAARGAGPRTNRAARRNRTQTRRLRGGRRGSAASRAAEREGALVLILPRDCDLKAMIEELEKQP